MVGTCKKVWSNMEFLEIVHEEYPCTQGVYEALQYFDPRIETFGQES